MILTIISDDLAVYKDSVAYSGLTLVGIPTDVHALHWNDSINAGFIEYKMDESFNKPYNTSIDSLPSWAQAASAQWDTANDEAVAAAAEFEANKAATIAAEAAALAELEDTQAAVLARAQELANATPGP